MSWLNTYVFLTFLLLVGCNGGGGGGEGVLGGGGSAPVNIPSISYSAASGIFEEQMSLIPTITPSGFAVTCSASSLPDGLTIDSETCVISGVPTEVGSGEFTVTVSNNSGSSTTKVRFTISPKAPTLSYAGVSSSAVQGSALTITPVLDTNGEELSHCTISPVLPAGLSINGDTCEISGTPTVSHNQLHTVTATNSAGSGQAEVSIVVLTSAATPLLSYSGVSGAGVLGVQFSVTPSSFQQNGASTTCSISPSLPAGVEINSSTCVISGVPTAVHSATHTVTATNTQGSISATVELSIEAAAPTLSYSPNSVSGTVNSALPAITATLNNGGAAITSCVMASKPSWLTIDNSTCAITGTPTAYQVATSYTVTVTNAGNKSSTASISIAVSALTPSLSYSPSPISGVVGTALSGITVNLNNGGAGIKSCVMASKPSWLTISNTTCEISGVPTAYQVATNYTVTVSNNGGLSSSTSITLSVNAPPTLSYSLAGGTSGVVNSEMSILPTTLLENGGAITDCYASVALPLPSYLTLNTTTCRISGTPTSVLSATTYTIYAKNQYGVSTAATVTLSVAAAPPSLNFAGAAGTTGTVNSPMTVTPVLNTNGGALTSCGIKSGTTALPSGLSVNASTCVISGTPTVVVNPAVTYTIKATNSAGSVDATVSLTVNAAPPTISYAPATVYLNSNIEISPTMNTNGSGITSCVIKPETTPLPTGLTINSLSCWITGTLTSTSSGTYTIVATNSAGSTEATLSLTVEPNKPTLSYSGSSGTNGVVGESMSVSPTSINTNGAAITSCTGSNLPSGLSVSSSDCVISGIPTVSSGSTSYTISATNSAGTTTVSVTLRIYASPVLNVSPLVNKSRPVGSCFGPVGLSVTSDQEIMPLNSAVSVDLSSDGSGAFYSDVNCTTEITSIDVGIVGRSEKFYFKNDSVETVNLTADPYNSLGMDRAVIEEVETYSVTSNTWIANTSTSGAAAGRSNHSAVWTGTEMIVWGGVLVVNGSGTNTGARYNPASDSWVGVTNLSGAPSARSEHSAIWTGTEMIIWGGYTGSYTNTGGRYNPTTNTWGTATQTTGAPAGRIFHTAIWTGTEMIIWGGYLAAGVTNTGGRYNPTMNTWGTATQTSGAPTARAEHTAIWTGTEMIIWGGFSSGTTFNTGGRYNPTTNTWGSAIQTSGAPSARYQHTGIWTGTEMIIWGGNANNGFSLNNGARYNPESDTWIGVTSTTGAPATRSNHSAIWTGTEMIVWGGNYLSTGGRYNPATDTWGQQTSSGSAPNSSRYAHSAVWTGTEMIIWGGRSTTNLNTGSRYNPVTDVWVSDTNIVGAATARYGHSAVWTGTVMVIWGGETASTTQVSTGSRYNPVSDSWSSTGSSGTGFPSARSYHSAVWTGTEMIIWGGRSSTTNLNSGGRYNLSTNQWVGAVSSSNAPSARYGHTGIWTGTRMLIWGGYGTDFLNSGRAYGPTNDQWSTSDIDSTNAPAARRYHTAVWTGSEMIVWGGEGSSGLLNDGGRYDFENDLWSLDPIPSGPAARFSHSAVWADDVMIIWGGRATDNLSDGSIYLP